MHYPVIFDADILIQFGVIDIFFSYNLKIQDGDSHHLGFLGYVILVIRRVDSVVFVLCTKFGSNIYYSH